MKLPRLPGFAFVGAALTDSTFWVEVDEVVLAGSLRSGFSRFDLRIASSRSIAFNTAKIR
jgi:hypothetical protein